MQRSNTLGRGTREGQYIGHNCTIERTVREESNDYGRAGVVEWQVLNLQGEPLDTLDTLADARRLYGFKHS